MNTFYQLWKVKTPSEAKAKIEEQLKEACIDEPKKFRRTSDKAYW